MLRDPRPTESVEEPRPKTTARRFQIVKLEERIAPRGSKYHGNNGGGNCHYNAKAGKYVGCGNDGQ